jgi:hypothetical protein
MPLEAPNLDDRRFGELFAEARSLIPRYAPEWTDHNESDPGITLLQLFAWLTEGIIYRLNRVPERNYIKFLQLIGVERKPASPARAELTFSLQNTSLSTVVIPKWTRVSAEIKPPPPSVVAPMVLPPEDEEPVMFETDEPLIALGAVLAALQVFDGINYREITADNAVPGRHFAPFGPLAREGSALLFGFESDNPFPTSEINLAVKVYFDPALLKPISCTPQELQDRLERLTCGAFRSSRPPARIQWEFWDSVTWRRLDVLKDETRAFTQSGHVYFRGPRGIIKDSIGAVTTKQLYWMRVRLLESQFEIAPEMEALLTNTVRATAVVTVRDEVIGSSNGEPDQRLLLRRTPVYAAAPSPLEEKQLQAESLRHSPGEVKSDELDAKIKERELIKGFLLEIDEGQGPKPWQEVEDFYNSSPSDRHYVLNRTTGEVRFGDGRQGRIPVAGINNLIARFYRYGGGARGNTGRDTITDLQTGIAGVESVTNLWPAEGGTDEEPLEDTKARAPKELKARDRAVTSQDFELLALQTPGVRVRRAHALPLYHPEFLGVAVPGVLTVIVVPESRDPKPMPSEATMQAVCEYLNSRRLLTTEVIVAPPRYKKVELEALVIARPTANPAEVKGCVETALTRYLHPLTGGEDGQGWPLGGDVLYSEVFRRVLSVDGVQTVNNLRIIVDGERMGACENAVIPDDFLVFSEGHHIDVTFTTVES